ncbi:MAG: LysR family transcriptional regulator [Deltaproteobacteria bacterium]|nr:LysR family transcriptional regulator [Deltaproteobacteria bacterium]MBL7204073.1 LysR family transcriptional regulator [Desulfobacteraceae bacterium]
MNLNQLKIFYMAAKRGSLSAAAKDLYITQPAVTKGIQRLQEYYEVKFVNRFGKKLALTDAGKVLYDIAEKIFEQERLAEDSIRDFQQQKRGHIRVDASESFGAYYLPSIITPFSKSSPQIRISVNILPTDLVVHNTVDLKNDLGFISYPVENQKLSVREVLEDRFVIIVAPDHPLAKMKCLKPEDLNGQSLIMHEKGSVPYEAIDRLISENNLSVFEYMEFSNNEAIKRTVEEGAGIALVSQEVAKKEIQMGKLTALPFCDSLLTRKFYMVHHKDKHISQILQRLIDTVDHWAAKYARHIS